EARPGQGNGPPDARTARPPLLPQGPLPVPFLSAASGHLGRTGLVARAAAPDRPAPSGAPPAHVALVAGQGPRRTGLFLGGHRCHGARPGAVLAALPGRRRAARGMVAATGALAEVAALPAAQ